MSETAQHYAARVERVPLGRTGVSVSRVILGCGSIGGIGSPASTRGKGLTPQEGLAQIDSAVGLGINTLDTANSYGGGVSEQTVGRWVSEHPEVEVTIATKVGNLVEPGQTDIDLSPAHIAEQVEISRSRLGRIDLYLSHAPDDRTPIEATLEAFAAVLESGRATAIGGCNLGAGELTRALDAAERLGLPCYGWVQNEYNLLCRDDEYELFALLRERGLGYTPFSPLSGGVLSGRYRRGDAPPADSRLAIIPEYMPTFDDALWTGLHGLAAAAERRGVTTAALALAWVLSSPDVTAPLVAPRRPEQFDDVATALNCHLDPDERTELATLFAS
ncbi:MAG: aldo/keto reductase [Pseudonocardiales bacterium]|nr:aldo/keto reductase [Pseudonocardiales bacterium]